MLRVLLDIEIKYSLVENIFCAIIETFPTKMSKKDFGLFMLAVSKNAVDKIKIKITQIQRNEVLGRICKLSTYVDNTI